MTKKKRTYYLMPEEPDPKRSLKNKNRMGKVMFFYTVTKPRYDADGVLTSDGKTGIWPFVKETAAVKNSKNRDKRTLEIKSMIVNRDVMKEYLCEKVIPAIEAIWPEDDEGTIYI